MRLAQEEQQGNTLAMDQARQKWAEEEHKSEGDVPTIADLTPYLGDWTTSFNLFIALGVNYKITPISAFPVFCVFCAFLRLD